MRFLCGFAVSVVACGLCFVVKKGAVFRFFDPFEWRFCDFYCSKIVLRALCPKINANTLPMSCVTSVLKSADVYKGRNFKIEVISQCMLVLRFLAIFQCGFAVFAEISCGFRFQGPL